MIRNKGQHLMVVMFQVLPRCSHAIGGNRPILVLQPKDNKTWGGEGGLK